MPAFLLSVGLAVILGAFTMSDDFMVDTVVIRGNSIAYADSIVEQSNAIGQSMFQINTDAVADQVVSHPVVESARVRVELPDRVVVDVIEREPAIVWQTDERAVLIDEYGWVLAEGDSEELPRVVELSGTPSEPGDHVDPGKVAAVQYLNERLGSDGVLEYDEDAGFQAYLGNERMIMFGAADELSVKLEVVAELSTGEQNWTRLDVRDPERPVYQ
ncbi:MAG: FtsQ-type POTRA domain-containing protein [Thermomicrobiaceae bacterium]